MAFLTLSLTLLRRQLFTTKAQVRPIKTDRGRSKKSPKVARQSQ